MPWIRCMFRHRFQKPIFVAFVHPNRAGPGGIGRKNCAPIAISGIRGKTYSGVYARMTWDAPSPTMTTQCYGFGNGRFGHPEQDRAISLREAAVLQTFPDDYEFLQLGEKPRFTEIGRWIGNAVPVRLAEEIGNLLITSNNKYNHDNP